MLKGNKLYILLFSVLLVLYIVAQLNQPKTFNWNPTLSNSDKNPFGASVLYDQLKQLYPSATIASNRVPPYNVLHDQEAYNSAYIMLSPALATGSTDLEEMLHYVRKGNVVLLSAYEADEDLLDTLGLKLEDAEGLLNKDSTAISLVNPALSSNEWFTLKKNTIDGYFSEVNKKDSTTILGIRKDSMPNFVKRQYGEGFFLVHAAPICLSNYFMLSGNNSAYTAKVLSYIPEGITTLYWDEYFKLGREGAQTPLRFFLSNTFLYWALMLTVAALLCYVFFEMKRRQRIIRVIEPLRNTTLDFVETVSSVYYSQHDNKSIAQKKNHYWLEHIRQRYYIATQKMDDTFIQQVQRKSGVSKELIEAILNNIKRAEAQPKVTDDLLLQLTGSIDEFYQQSKT
ncbi:DUF4350 domain-containing protein [soil metagenome]